MGSTDSARLPSDPDAPRGRRRALTPQALDDLLAGATIVTHDPSVSRLGSATTSPTARRAALSPAAGQEAPSPAAQQAGLSGEWQRLRLYAGGALLVICFALFGWQIWRGRDPAPVALHSLVPGGGEAGAEIRVQVAGEVAQPGVYRLAAGDRVEDAVQAAGGLTAAADAGRVNLAQRLRDEQRIDVPAVLGPGQRPATSGSGGSLAEGGGPAPAGSVVPTGSARPMPDATRRGQKVDVNKASVAELEALPGIGEATARRIAEYRSASGPIRSLEQLRAAGISDTLLRRAAEYLAFE